VRVLVLSWDALAPSAWVAPQAAGLAVALAASGDDVRLVTRLGPDRRRPQLPGVEVHAVPDAPPIVSPELRTAPIAALGFASRAAAVAGRRLEERPVDAVHAEGWQTGPVAASLSISHDVAIVAAVDLGDREPGDNDDGPEAYARATGRELARSASLVVYRSAPAATRTAVLAPRSSSATAVVVPGVDTASRRPGPPPAAGPVWLVPPGRCGTAHRDFARALRVAMDHRRAIAGTPTRRPFAAAVLDPHDLDAALTALALGVPLLAAAGPVGDLAVASGGGRLVAPTPAGVAAALATLRRDPAAAAALGRSGSSYVATSHTWSTAASSWRAAVAAVVASNRDRGQVVVDLDIRGAAAR